MSNKEKMVMVALDEMVNWHKDRNQIVLVAKENLAKNHPAVVKERKELWDRIRKLELAKIYHDNSLLDRIYTLSLWEFWKFKHGMVPQKMLAPKRKDG